MQRDRLQEENRTAQQARSGELSMLTAVEDADERDGLWDPKSGDVIEPGMTDAEREILERQDAALTDDDDVISRDQAQVGTLGQHRTRTDGPAIGPLGTPIEPLGEEDPDEVTRAVNVGSASQRALPDEAPRVGAGQSPARTVQRLDRAQETRIIRVNADLDPTIGRENYHFMRGKRYEVPLHVALHLHEKGYVSSWG